MREHWREPDYWLWFWRQRFPSEAKLVVGALLVAGLLGGGWFAADRLTAAHAGVSGTEDYILETTVQKVITVREKGRLVRKLVPVVKRVYVKRRTATAYETKLKYTTRVLTTPGAVRVVRRLITTVVPRVKKSVIKVNGKTRTVVRTQLVPTIRTQTQTQTETRVDTVTNTQNVTQPGVTQTQTEVHNDTKTQTVTQTQTQTQTQTETQTNTQTQTVTETTETTVTDTATVTQTVTDTVTETVTETVPG